jgi:hypothetical protein
MSWAKPTIAAPEKLAADGLLQTRDVAAHRRLAQAQQPPGRGEPARALDCEEGAQQVGVQHIDHHIRSEISDISAGAMSRVGSTFSW